MKKISSKRKKTDSDLEELARLEFMGSLYMNGTGPVLPARVLEATIINGAKKGREGLTAKAGIFVEDDYLLEYNGPKDREGLWTDEHYRYVAGVVVGKARIMRTRPIFEEWSCKIIVNYDDSQVNEGRVLEWLNIAGQQVGVCELRPRFGRFGVERID